MDKYTQFSELLESLKGDFEKFYDKSNAAAGSRVRKGLQSLAVLCKETRKDVTEIKVARKTSE